MIKRNLINSRYQLAMAQRVSLFSIRIQTSYILLHFYNTLPRFDRFASEKWNKSAHKCAWLCRTMDWPMEWNKHYHMVIKLHSTARIDADLPHAFERGKMLRRINHLWMHAMRHSLAHNGLHSIELRKKLLRAIGSLNGSIRHRVGRYSLQVLLISHSFAMRRFKELIGQNALFCPALRSAECATT